MFVQNALKQLRIFVPFHRGDDMTKLDQLKKHAIANRNWCENLYQRDKSSKKWHGQWDSALTGMCAVASYDLFIRLKSAGFKPEYILGDCHAFIICNGYLIDTTATQFNISAKKIEIRRWTKKIAERYNFWCPQKKYTTIRGIHQYFKDDNNDNWPLEQTPAYVMDCVNYQQRRNK